MESGQEEIPLEELIRAFIEADRISLHVCLPVKVEAVTISATKQTVDVTIQVNNAIPDGKGNYISEAFPKISDVPVGFMRGGGYFVSLPIAVGDYGMVICAERNLGAWRQSGSLGDPGDLGMHTLDGAWFLPCIAPDNSSIQNADANNFVLGTDSDPNARIVIKPGEIDAGANSTNFVAMADKVKAWLDAFNAAVTAWVPVANDGGAALKTALGTLIGGVPSTTVASSNLKAMD